MYDICFEAPWMLTMIVFDKNQFKYSYALLFSLFLELQILTNS